MTMGTTLFTAALGLTPPWEMTNIRFDAEARQVDIDVGFTAGSRFACPSCGETDGLRLTDRRGAGSPRVLT